MTERVDFLVVGGGIVGAATADALARDGADVLIVDRAEPGQGCSLGNAGWVTPCFAMPLPRPGLLGTALRWMADPESPFHMSPRLLLSHLPWLARFALSMDGARFRRGTESLVELSRFSLDAYHRLSDEHGVDFGMRRRGLLMLALTQEGLKSARADAEMMADLDVEGRCLDGDAVLDLEPALRGGVSGGVYYPDEAHLDPLGAVRALVRRAERSGARVSSRTEVFDFELQGDRITRVHTTRGPVEAREVVLTAGSWSSPLAERLGLRIPLLGGKGYSMMVPAPDPAPRSPIMVLEKKVAITPYGDELRLAGTLELVDGDRSISPRRVRAIQREASRVLAIARDAPADHVWRGLRPCTPDGLPIIGTAPSLENAFVATGHQMLGVQTAPGTGRLAADLLLGRAPTFDPAPFRPGRF